MIRPLDLQDEDLWNIFQACANGDVHAVSSLLSRRPELLHSAYNYTPPLHFAVREEHVSVVRLLLARGANPIYPTHRFLDSLLTMAQDRDYSEIAQIMQDIVARQFPLADGIGAFLEAATRGDLALVQEELARHPQLARVSNDTGDTALHQAVLGGHREIVNALLDAGATVDATRADGRRPIHFALAHRNSKALLQVLFDHGAEYNVYLAAGLGDVNYLRDVLANDSGLANFEDSSHSRPISAAARRNDLQMVRLLLQHGANPSLPEEGAPLGQALWIAVYQNQPEMARLLLEHGANPNTAPESSGSALFQARKYPGLHQLLIQFGAREDTSDKRKLETAIADNDLEEVESILQQNPQYVHDPMLFWGEGILSAPANHRNHEMIQLLLRHGARVPDVCKWGPQYYFKHAAIGELLLQRGMNPNQMNWQRFTLLHHFAADGDLTKVRLLLDHSAAINAIDEEYRSTPLGCAARWGQHPVVTLLLERGADPSLAAAPWATPLAWARKRRHPQIESTLLRAGAN